MPKNSEQKPVQHTPRHLEDEVFDPRHPSASSFAVAQPAAGVVADDVEDRGQNLAGGPKASDAQKTYRGQKEVLVEQHNQSTRANAGLDKERPEITVEGDTAKPAKK